MVEIDVRKFGMKDVLFESVESAWSLAKRYWFHFLSLVTIIAFMMPPFNFSPELSVFWATVVSFATSFLRRDTALLRFEKKSPLRSVWNSGFLKALEGGSLAVLNVAATCAGAGLIVGVVTLTGLGLRFSEIVIGYAGGSLVLTAIFTALIVWVVGLAVPVTASYIICAVIAAPALIRLGVPDFAAHMFIFYYAVLSEVSPPTALSPFAAAAITGGDPYKTTLQSWKYTLPAFVVPFMFVLDPLGVGLLLSIPKGGSWLDVAGVTTVAVIALFAFSGVAEGWLWKKTNAVERLLLLAAGVIAIYPHMLYQTFLVKLPLVLVALAGIEASYIERFAAVMYAVLLVAIVVFMQLRGKGAAVAQAQ